MLQRLGICCVLALLLAIPACDEDGASNPMSDLSLTVPRVTGIWLTNEPAYATGIWGRPTGVRAVYPNPFEGSTFFLLEVHQPCHARVWVSPAVGPAEEITDSRSRLGMAVTSRNAGPLKVLFDDSIPQPFEYIAVVYDGTDNAGRKLPSGFYRFYVTLNDSLTWSDALLVHDPAEVDRFLTPSLYPDPPVAY